MPFCGKIGGVRSFLTSTATVYTISKTKNTLTGQPIETLVLLKTIKVHFEPRSSDEHGLFSAGQIKIGQFTAISLDEVLEQQVLEIKNIKYRVLANNEIRYKNKTFYWQLHLEFFRHNNS